MRPMSDSYRTQDFSQLSGVSIKALRHYEAFVRLWKDADPVLQPRVGAARQRLTALTREAGASR